MAMKGYSAFPKAPTLLEPLTIRLFSAISRTLVGGVLPLCKGAVGVFYSTPPADWANWEYISVYVCLHICVHVYVVVFVHIYMIESIPIKYK